MLKLVLFVFCLDAKNALEECEEKLRDHVADAQKEKDAVAKQIEDMRNEHGATKSSCEDDKKMSEENTKLLDEKKQISEQFGVLLRYLLLLV